MPYTIRTKDGMTVSDIPSAVDKNDPQLKALIGQMRTEGKTSGAYSDLIKTTPAPAPAPAPSPTLKPYPIVTKDGITVTDIPGTIDKRDPRLKTLVEQLRVAGKTSAVYSEPNGTVQQPDYGTRPDGTQKGSGYLGPLTAPNGNTVTEYSVGISIDGKEIDIPSLVPTLTKDEVQSVLDAAAKGTQPPQNVIIKATDFARGRLKAGLPVFAESVPEQSQQPQGIIGQITTDIKQPGFVTGVVEGIPKNLGIAARGVVQGAASLATTVMDPIQAIVNLIPGLPKGMLPSDAVTFMLDKLGVPNAKTEAQKVMQAATAGLAGAGSTIAAGRAAAEIPGMLGAAGKTLAAQPLQQGVAAAVGGATSEAMAAVDKELPPPAQFALEMGAGLAGGMVGAGTVGAGGLRFKTNPLPAGLIPAADSLGVRVMTSDVRPPKNLLGQLVQVVGELLGTGADRKAQQVERIAAVKTVLNQYGAGDLAPTLTRATEDLLLKREAALTKWKASKTDVITRLSEPNGDMGIKSTNVVPMPLTTAKINATISELTALNTASVKPVITILQDWKNATQNQNLQRIEILRKQFGESFVAPELASVRSTGEQALSNIYDSVNADMGNFIKSTGKVTDFAQWKNANAELTTLNKELELGVLKRVIDVGATTPEQIKTMLFSQDKSTVEALYRNLSPNGQAAARAALLSKAADAASGQELSPNKFIASIKKLGTQTGVFFTGDDAKVLDGLERVLTYTDRAEQKPMSLPTGIKGTLMLPVSISALTGMFGGGMQGIAYATGAGAGIGLLAKAYESPAIRNLLARLPVLKQGSPEEAALLKRLIAVGENLNQTKPGETQTSVAAPKPDTAPPPFWSGGASPMSFVDPSLVSK